MSPEKGDSMGEGYPKDVTNVTNIYNARPKALPRMTGIDIRKFAIEQAVNALPNLRNGVLTLDVAKEFEDYILNGRGDNVG